MHLFPYLPRDRFMWVKSHWKHLNEIIILFTFFLFFKFTHSANTYWFFVPICAPFLGAVVGVLMYQLMIGYHLERDVQEKQKMKDEEE